MDMHKQNRVTEPVPFLGGQVEGRPGNGEVGVSRSGRFLLGDRRDTVVGPGAGRVRLAEALVAAIALLSAGAVMAEPLAIPRNAPIVSSDGVVLGKVDRVLTANDTVTGVQLILGSKMIVIPGDTLSLDGDTVKTTVTVKEVIAAKKRVILDTTCKVGDTVVIEGEATVMIGNKPA